MHQSPTVIRWVKVNAVIRDAEKGNNCWQYCLEQTESCKNDCKMSGSNCILDCNIESQSCIRKGIHLGFSIIVKLDQ